MWLLVTTVRTPNPTAATTHSIHLLVLAPARQPICVAFGMFDHPSFIVHRAPGSSTGVVSRDQHCCWVYTILGELLSLRGLGTSSRSPAPLLARHTHRNQQAAGWNGCLKNPSERKQTGAQPPQCVQTAAATASVECKPQSELCSL